MKLNESRLAVAEELQKKLSTLNAAITDIYGFQKDTDAAELMRLLHRYPEIAVKKLRKISALVELMKPYLFHCCDLAGDLVESLEHGTKCVLIPEPEPMPEAEPAKGGEKNGKKP